MIAPFLQAPLEGRELESMMPVDYRIAPIKNTGQLLIGT
jgi:hypothetical protein